jgi:nicotinamidase-related amidase
MKRALLVIDVQNEYVTGRLPIQHPPLEVSLPAIQRAIQGAHELRMPIILVQQDAPVGSPIFAHGSDGWQLHPTVADGPRTAVVSKALPSAFAGTSLDDELTDLGVDTIAIAGYMTQNCDESTARDAAHRGYAVEFLSDATGAPDLSNRAGAVDARTLHETTLTVMESRFAAVVTVDEWISAARGDVVLAPSGITASVHDPRIERLK